MEGSMNIAFRTISVAWMLILFLIPVYPGLGFGQEDGLGELRATIRLRKTVKEREYEGQLVQGEEREIVSGDTLWRILIDGKGLEGKHFQRYLVLVGSLNPQLKDPNILRIGDVLFIPLRPDEVLGLQVPPKRMGGQFYRVRRGDYLFKILREQRGIRGANEVFRAFDQIKTLNPRKKNWDLIFVGEAILLPPVEKGALPIMALSSGSNLIGLDYGLKLPVNENLDLLQKITGIVGSKVSRKGEEQLALREGTVYIDRSLFPVIRSSRSGKRVVLNMGGRITPSLQEELQSQNPQVSVVTVKKGISLHDAADTVFSKMGFQALPTDRPIVVQDQGVGIQVKGEWMVASQDKDNMGQEMWIISLADISGKTPDYLKKYLSMKGMNLKEVVIPSSFSSQETDPTPSDESRIKGEIETWPHNKEELVDVFLNTYEIPFSAGEKVSFPLSHGIRVNATVDRLLDMEGGKVGVFFSSVGDDVKQALLDKKAIRPVELELENLSSRQILSTLLATLGKDVIYQKLRFPVFEGGQEDKLVLTVSGFFLPTRSLLLTDQIIPKELQRFFFDKGMRVAYFR